MWERVSNGQAIIQPILTDIFLLELSSQVSLDESGLPCAAVTHEHALQDSEGQEW